jgi:hypothetical protein
MIRVLLLLVVALPAWAQETQKPPAEPKKEPQRRPLNLRLENPSSFATMAPDSPPAKELPTLGDDARKIKPAAVQPGTRPEGGPYPKDTNPNQ